MAVRFERKKATNQHKLPIIQDDELIEETPDDILNETIFSEKPLEEKKVPGKDGSASQDREQKKHYKGFVSSVEDIKRFSMFGAKVLLNVNGVIKDRRMHLAQNEALSIIEPSYRLFDRNILSKAKDLLPEIGDENLRDVKEIITALGSWGARCALVTIFDYTTKTEQKIAESQLNTFNLQQELRRRQAEAHAEFQKKNEPDKEGAYVGGTNSKDDSLNLISIDPNQIDPGMIGPENDGVYGV